MTATTRERILGTAQQMLQTRSFHGFSFDDLAKKVGIRKPSLYHHFKSKDDLGAAILAQVTGRLEAASRAGDGSGAEQLRAYLTWMGDALGAGERLCPGGACIATWGVLPRRIRSSVERMGEVHTQWLARILERGRGDGSLAIGDRPIAGVARWIFATVQGALMLARVSAERRSYDEVIDQLADALTARAR